MTIQYLAPLDQPELRAVIEGDLEPRDAERVDAGADVVVAPAWPIWKGC